MWWMQLTSVRFYLHETRLFYNRDWVIDEHDMSLEYVFYTTDTIRQWVYQDNEWIVCRNDEPKLYYIEGYNL